MKLFHGTSSVHVQSLTDSFKEGTWMTEKSWHALRLAERTAKRDGGIPIIIAVEVNIDQDTVRVMGRYAPTYRFNKSFKPDYLEIMEMIITQEIAGLK